ncbi:MAG: prepilin peptidase [Pirellulales bacterium]|nr:prepilin peptidase [Pirellulales bacterium]
MAACRTPYLLFVDQLPNSRIGAMQWQELVFIVVALSILGACIGSFLNVVAYRLPRSMSLSRPPSQCPACGHAIRWSDNVPVLGWLRLRGRCRDCSAPIAARYPMVEATTALIVLIVGMLALLSRGGSADTAWIARTACDAALCLTLLSVALIQWDGNYIPGRLLLPALVIGLVVPLVWPESKPRLALTGMSEVRWGPRGAVVNATVLGAAYGLLVAALAQWLRRSARGKPFGPPRSQPEQTSRIEWYALPTLIGLFWGWPAVLVIIPVAVALGALVPRALRRAMPLGAALLVVAMLYLAIASAYEGFGSASASQLSPRHDALAVAIAADRSMGREQE